MENGDALYARIAELEEENTYTTVALLYGKKYNLKYWQCIGTGTNGKVTLPNMIALKKSCTCHVCGYLEEDIKQSDQLVCGCDVCNLPLCDHCRATDDENNVVDDSICQDCYDEQDPDRCVKCDLRFDQRKLLNDYDCAWAWDLHCDIGDDEGDLCGACLEKWVEGQLLFFRFVESEMKKELKDE